jgi:predicted tellurium resistance membrane protein TerC
MKSTAMVSNGIGFEGLLTIVFIALKLMGYITWSWVWVLSPLWISLIVVFVVFGIVLVFLLLTNDGTEEKEASETKEGEK